jgi:hypothetical protein
MSGQWSNFRKNFEKAFNLADPYINVAKRLGQAAMVGGNVFWNMNKLDDPNLTDTEKGKAIFNVITAPLAAVPGLGTVVSGVGDAAEYVSDVITGKKDAPPKPADINSKNNPGGNIPNAVINSTPFKQYFNNFGYGRGIF